MKRMTTDYIKLAGKDYQSLYLEKEKYRKLYETYRIRYEMEKDAIKNLEKKLLVKNS